VLHIINSSAGHYTHFYDGFQRWKFVQIIEGASWNIICCYPLYRNRGPADIAR